MYVYEWDMYWKSFWDFALVTKKCEKYVKNSPFFEMSAILKFNLQKEKNTFFWRKLSKLHKKRPFACDNYIFPKTRANKNKQWTHYSALKC